MAEVKWYTLTPGRRMLLGALGVSLAIFLAMFSRCSRTLERLKDADEQQPVNNKAR